MKIKLVHGSRKQKTGNSWHSWWRCLFKPNSNMPRPRFVHIHIVHSRTSTPYIWLKCDRTHQKITVTLELYPIPIAPNYDIIWWHCRGKTNICFSPSVVGSRMETSPTCLKIVGTVTHPWTILETLLDPHFLSLNHLSPFVAPQNNKNIQASNHLKRMSTSTHPRAFPTENKHIFLNVILRERPRSVSGGGGQWAPNLGSLAKNNCGT